MSKYLFLPFIFIISFSLFADEGDTTFVQAHNYVDLDWNGNYDAWGVFPDGST